MKATDFEQVVVVGLARRPERLAHFWKHLPRPWPFRQIQHVSAIDGARVKPPDWYRPTHPNDHGKLMRRHATNAPDLSGAWGCLRSHHRIWESALNSGTNSVLVFEDDAVFVPDFNERLTAFLDAVPDDWDMLYLGGQHLGTDNQWPVRVSAEVLRGRYVNRTHAYAVRGEMLGHLYRHFSGTWASAQSHRFHVDHQLCDIHREFNRWEGRFIWNVYCPRHWLVGQAEGISDVKHQDDGSGKPEHEHWWDHFEICEEANVPGPVVAACG